MPQLVLFFPFGATGLWLASLAPLVELGQCQCGIPYNFSLSFIPCQQVNVLSLKYIGPKKNLCNSFFDVPLPLSRNKDCLNYRFTSVSIPVSENKVTSSFDAEG